MSVAENPTLDVTSRTQQQQLAIGSAIGAVALLAGLWFVFAGLPELWWTAWESVFADPSSEALLKNVFLADSLLILLDLGVIAALVYGAYRVLQQQTQPGLRAGIFFGAIYIFGVLWVGVLLGAQLDSGGQFVDNVAVGWAIIFVVMAALLAGAGYVYLMLPGWLAFLEAVEHQGWFHAYAFKGNQGVRVRRGTIVGVLAVGAAGIITLVQHRFFGSERPDLPNDWLWHLPFFDAPGKHIPVMFKVHLLMPIVLTVLLLWFAWRVVNIPGFADFLIATEAEMNKVSWTNRKRLMADTIVVLTTVFLFTTFLFVVDVIWIKVLSAPYIQVLLIDPKQEQQKQQEKAQW